MTDLAVMFKDFEYNIKKIYNYENMPFTQKIDFDEEISSLLPTQNNEIFYKYYLNFEEEMLKNSSKSVIINILRKLFNDQWIFFVYLNILNSFSFQSSAQSSSVENLEKSLISAIPNSYNDSHIIFNRNVEILQNLLITLNFFLDLRKIKKIKTLVQISLKILINSGLIEEKKNYAHVEVKAHKGYFKTIISYKLIINFAFNKIFNVINKFHRHPLLITDYKIEIKIGNKVKIENRTLISGPSYVRGETYDKINPYNYVAFNVKNKQLRNLYAETRFYPDLDFIRHIKSMFWNYLDYDEIKTNLEITKNKIEETFQITNWNDKEKTERAELQKQYAKFLEDEKIYIFLNHTWDETYFLSSTNDYRGRKYYCSSLTFTQFKLSRYCFHYGSNGEFSKNYFNWKTYDNIFKELFESRNLKMHPYCQEVVGFYLIGMGKFDSTRKTQINTSLEEILKKGNFFFKNEKNILYENLKKNWSALSLKNKIDAVELECYRFGLRALLNGDVKKRIILKDATASGYQIQAYSTGCSDFEKLKHLNLGKENNFVDTYLVIVDFFNQKHPIKESFKKYFKRGIIKKFCMIIPYSAGFEECFKHIKPFISENDCTEAEQTFKLFFKFIKNELWKDLGFTTSFKDFIKNLIQNNKKINPENEFFVESDTAFSNLLYFKHENKQLDTIFTNKFGNFERTSRSYLSLTEKKDMRQTLSSFFPNFTHFHDSDIIRILHLEPYNLKFASIHDAFIISSFDCGKLVHSYGTIFKIKIRFPHEIPITCLM